MFSDMKILFTWLGMADLRAASGSAEGSLGPIGQAVSARDFDQIVILSDHSPSEDALYVEWIKKLKPNIVVLAKTTLTRPTDFGEIYEHAVRVVESHFTRTNEPELTFHLSPGTPAMAAVWIILSKTRFPAQLIESSIEEGVRTVSLPFDLSAEYLPDLLKKPDDELKHLSLGLPPQEPEFERIVHRCAEMKRLILQARRIALRDVPVLIQGESGTGKELFARAIHQSSPRKGKPFVAINCGAIPDTLMDAEFFGYEKGAFTGANIDRAGYFKAADGGTLFLDEIGELSLFSQVKLLRVIQERSVTPLGSTRPQKLNLRLIAATNKNLIHEVAEKRFREDLFHRIAVGILTIPPLRDRKGDIGLLTDAFLIQLNEELSSQPGFLDRRLSPAARKILIGHSWPGNVRELKNTLLRAAVWSTNEVLSAAEVSSAVLSPSNTIDAPLNRQLGDGFSLRDLLGEVARHYVSRALQQSNGVKTEAAKLLGLPNYQTLVNWMDKYHVTQ